MLLFGIIIYMKVAVIGHRNVKYSLELYGFISNLLEILINDQDVDTFIFGSKSNFNDICYDVVSDLLNQYKFIKRVYLRAAYKYINDDYEKYLLSFYEATEYPNKVDNAGALSYIKRNEAMIDMSDLVLVYYNKDIKSKNRFGKMVSGTAHAVKYAEQTNKPIINVADLLH